MVQNVRLNPYFDITSKPFAKNVTYDLIAFSRRLSFSCFKKRDYLKQAQLWSKDAWLGIKIKLSPNARIAHKFLTCTKRKTCIFE